MVGTYAVGVCTRAPVQGRCDSRSRCGSRSRVERDWDWDINAHRQRLETVSAQIRLLPHPLLITRLPSSSAWFNPECLFHRPSSPITHAPFELKLVRGSGSFLLIMLSCEFHRLLGRSCADPSAEMGNGTGTGGRVLTRAQRGPVYGCGGVHPRAGGCPGRRRAIQRSTQKWVLDVAKLGVCGFSPASPSVYPVAGGGVASACRTI